MNIVKSGINKWQIFITPIFFLPVALFPLRLEAAIISPYSVDEKPQVVFGDSVSINDGEKTYFGLENYQYEYREGYLFMSFTYTHHFCCYDNSSPRIHITNLDPRSTTTLAVRSSDYAYQFFAGQPTNWYLYEIQFDALGYRVVVKGRGESEFYNQHTEVSGLNDLDWVALANTHPLGPNGEPNSNTMAFTPLPIKSVIPPPPARNPVIIVPGIIGSTLAKKDNQLVNELWPNIPQMLLPGQDIYLNDLILNSDGSKNSDIFASQIITEVRGHVFFSSLINTLKISQDIFEFPYDWRLDNLYSANLLKDKIEEAKSITGARQVNIVAHSMGGLIVKEYIKNYSTNSIDKFIDIGTPHLGAPKAAKILIFGDNFGFEKFGFDILNMERTKIISQNMPAVYQLLPSGNYLNQSKYIYDLDDLDNDGVRGDLTFDQTKNFLKNTGRNSLLLNKAEDLHNEIDSLDPRDFGVDTYNIVGCGTPTLGKIFMLNKESSGGAEYNILYIQGDGTVPLISAKSLPTNHLYYYKNAIHAVMPSSTGIKELIDSILKDEDINSNDFNNISTSESDCPKINGQVVSFHSPINLHVYDTQNRHTGPLENGDIENNIPGVAYEVIGGNKFAFLPDGESYKIFGIATESGRFNARIEKITEDNLIETKYFNNLSLVPTTKVTFDITLNTSNTISIDNNGDGIYESQVQASAILNQSQSSDIIKPTTQIVVEGKKKDQYDPFSKPVMITFVAADDNSGILKTEYSFNNGLSWVNFLVPFALSTKGENKILYHSTDRAGNIESPKMIIITIGKPGKN